MATIVEYRGAQAHFDPATGRWVADDPSLDALLNANLPDPYLYAPNAGAAAAEAAQEALGPGLRVLARDETPPAGDTVF